MLLDRKQNMEPNMNTKNGHLGALELAAVAVGSSTSEISSI